ncbi:hypothetical protein ABB26_12480 [Stenotrophomonas humi]|uniref:Peptidase S24/S26A/S26B/S26C domain-containing protein n=1 Tax=Stenotrophomonas humi TaxID=405444 RepID=A0A0R0C0L3_9GAMM|nr:hypothetical protein [Stenotrophomonas humi]KRG63369.1 hypothetical protein ABB26_12480 [Stenotrophomonas humi]
MNAPAQTQPQIESYPSPVLMPPPQGQAYVLVRDNLNAPTFEIGDVLQVDLSVVRCRWDGVYVIELNGRQIVRRVQVRPGKNGRPSFYVFTTSNRDLGFFVEFDELVVLGEVKTVCCVRSVS